tara:strand:+ start:1137 stop:1502 length:366 start_codon:yes stop_codon:yes gene_type:complete
MDIELYEMPATLDKWSLSPIGLGPYDDPSLARGVLCIGTVLDHPNFEDGEEIQTSEVIEFDELECAMRTRNRTYSLGTVCPRYQRWRTRRADGEPVQPVKYNRANQTNQTNQTKPIAKRAG